MMPQPPFDPLVVLQASIDAYVAHSTPLLLPIGIIEAAIIAVIMLMFTALRAGADHLSGKKADACIIDILSYLALAWLVSMELTLYMPLVDSITAVGRWLSNIIAVHNLNLVFQNIDACIQGLQHPGTLDIANLILYWIVLGLMSLLDVVLLLVTAPAFVLFGVGRIVGPILIPLQLLPWFKGKFWHWFNFMIMFGIGYRVLAGIWTAIFADFLLNFFNNVVAHNYSFGHLLALLALQVTVIIITVGMALLVPYVAHELFGHGGSAGGYFGGSLRTAATILLFR